eukprot:scaffold11824_cov78-Skeletonema_dohrnii-CCMP3373.AAC.2
MHSAHNFSPTFCAPGHCVRWHPTSSYCRHILLLASGFWVASNIMPVQLIDFRWYHAVNDQNKLDNVLASSAKHTQLHAIEAEEEVVSTIWYRGVPRTVPPKFHLYPPS